MSDNPYSRFYWRFIDEYPDIYDDKTTFGWWLTLLVIAEGAHPSPAHLPAGVNRKCLSRLVEAGLVELGTGQRFRMKGLVRERERRSGQARYAAKARWQSERSAPALQTLSERNAQPMPRRDETSKDETRRDEQGFVEPDYDERLAIARRRQGLPA